MKTHVITLQSYDDIHSLADRLKWVKSDRVLVIFPRSPGEFRSKLDLIRLQRIAQSQVIRLGIVTTSDLVLDVAHELNIPSFRDPAESRQKLWRLKARPKIDITLRKAGIKRNRPSNQDIQRMIMFQKKPWIRLMIFLCSLISIMMIVFVLLPHATISIAPIEQIQMLDLTLKASSYFELPDVSGNIPLYTQVIKITVEGSLATSGISQLGEQKSKGIVEIENISQKDVEIPAGSVILIEGEPEIRLITLKKGSISSNRASSLTMPVQCETPGVKCNLSKTTTLRFQGALNDTLLVTLEVPLTGGKDMEVPFPSMEDLGALRKQLLAAAEVKLNQKIEELRTNEIIFLDSVIEPIEVNDLTTVGLEHQAASTITKSIEVVYAMHFIYRKDISEISQAALGAIMPEGWQDRPGTLYWEKLSEESTHDAEFTFHIRAAQLIHKKVNQNLVSKMVSGKTRKNAFKIIYSNLDIRQDPQIEMPGLYFWMPVLPSNIKVELQ